MSSDNPYAAAAPGGPGPERPEHLGPPSGTGDPGDSGRTEYLGDATSRRPRRPGRRPLLLTAAAVAVVGVVGAGAWGVAQLVGGGPEPAAAVPSDALAYLAVDLDPSAAQKVEALRTLRKFPALADELDLGSRDDVREWLFDQIKAGGRCDDLTFDDVESWLGYRVGVAAVPAAEPGADPEPVVVVQVDDEDAARDGADELLACTDQGERPGRAFVAGYLVLAETQDAADRVAEAAASAPLSEDSGFHRRMDEAGDPGIITGYVSADLPEVLVEEIQAGSAGDWLAAPGLAGTASSGSFSTLSEGPDTPAPAERAEGLRRALEDFEGAAAVVRFDDGAVEAEVVAQGLPGQDLTSTGNSGIQQLPTSTAVALGVSLGDGWAERMLDQLRTSLGDEADVDRMLAEVEAETGLDLPQDAERLLGDGVSLAVDSRVDVSALADGGSPDPSDLPLGLRITGDPDQITAVLDKLTALLGPAAGETLVVEEGEGAVAVGVDPGYVETLAGDGGLGDDESFTRVVPEAGDLGGALFVDFDEGDWLEQLVAETNDADAQEAADNLRPLAALGASGWMDGEVAHGLLTLTTD